MKTLQSSLLGNVVRGRLDPPAVELAVLFIEADPRFDGSDSMKVRLAACLEHVCLTADQRNRLAAVLLRGLRHGTDTVFDAYARLAPAVTTPIFEAAVTCYTKFCDPRVAGRAARLLDVLRGSRPDEFDAAERERAVIGRRAGRVLCASAD